MVRRVFWARITPLKGEVTCRPGVLMKAGGVGVATGGEAVPLVVGLALLVVDTGSCGAWARVWWRHANQATRSRGRKDFIAIVYCCERWSQRISISLSSAIFYVVKLWRLNHIPD